LDLQQWRGEINIMTGMTLIFLFLVLATSVIVGSWFLAPRFWTTVILGMSQRSSGLHSATRVVDGIHWHYLAGGKGPTLVLLHGFGADESCWLKLAPRLRQNFSLVIPDLPGFGKSENPEKLTFAIEAQASRLAAFLDEIDVRSCILAGNSMGGYLAAALAARDHERIHALWLLAPLGVRSVAPGELLSAVDAGDSSYFEARSVREYCDRVIPMLYAKIPWIPSPLAYTLAHQAMARKDIAPKMLREARFDSEPLESVAQRVRQPVLIIWGANDRVVNPEGLPALESVLANSDSLVLNPCGHLPMLECPEESARAFSEFIQKRELA
jgi:pimeloyl-ACP methyl ester carboxylesterase